MTLRFEEWLTNQQLRQDGIGDLARVPGMRVVEPIPTRRAPDEHKSWVDIVIRNAAPQYIADFNDAWQEFLLAKEAARDDLD
ncbi:hypothetical protein [Promineifilum sp.]|uniref:hypothetical protein n=1 Tax=Promineifilum sp. TaxID=2664178 RepID=UPI0035B30A8F